jgi:hypothetical protein
MLHHSPVSVKDTKIITEMSSRGMFSGAHLEAMNLYQRR